MNKHTPGPWEAHYHGEWDRWEIGNYKTYKPHAFVPDFQIVRKGGMCEAEANARLISACPDMLEALKGLFEHCAMVHKHWGDGDNTKEANAAILAATSAIQKAEGN
jgi:hypothetical protein